MKKIYIIIIILLLLIILLLYPKKNNLKITYQDNFTKMNTINKTNRTKINIYIPITKYQKLNHEIKKTVDNYLDEFNKESLDSPPTIDTYNTLYILYDEYYYKEYISIVLYIEKFTGGAHPNHTIKTIIYNKETNNFITIDNLIEDNPNILNNLSTISRETLLNNPKFKDNLVKDMLYTGTSPNKENFTNIAYTPNGLNVYFDYYQIAPYYYGYSEILIPYDKLNL